MLDQPITSKMLAEKDGAVGRIIFNNPARHNAVSIAMWQAVPRILDAFARDDEVRVIVLSGAGGKAFVSGADISEFGERRGSREAILEYNKIADEAHRAIADCKKPTIAMIQGYCIGGGLAVALCCDLRIASENSRFGVPAAKLGLGYGFPGIKRRADVVGPSFAKEIFFTARQFDTDEALDMGLINRVRPSAELESYVRGYAETIAANAPLTIAAVKLAASEYVKDPEDRDLAACQAAVDACFASQDYVEGRTAFMEKRRPAFRGR
jgi:enoyl-CoA hydratase/carnithine racemase